MKDTNEPLGNSTHAGLHSKKYLDAVAKHEEKLRRREQNGFATMLVAASMAGGVHEVGKPGRVVRLARSFCILFAFASPSVLVIRYLL